MKVAVLIMPSDVDDIEKDEIEEEFVSVRAKDRLALRGDNMTIQEFGGSGNLDPEPYTKYNQKNICAGVGIPFSVIYDIDRPSDVGNDQNLKNYYSLVKRIQRTVLEVHLRGTIDELVKRQQLRAAEYKIEWLPFEEVSFGERSQAVMRENLGLEKMMGAFERAKELGFAVPTDEYTFSLTPYGAMKLVKKPELSPEQFYGGELEENVKTAVGNNVILPVDTATSILITAMGNAVYGKVFYAKHIRECNKRLATLTQGKFFNGISKEEGARPADMMRNAATAKMLTSEIAGNEQRYKAFINAVENYAAAGIEKMRVKGSCPTCKAQNRYGVYPVQNVARLPQFPLHGKKCIFETHPY
ncbi:MAG: hypothetical protein JRL30_28535 [Deltaproteobacteria bacterium]|nr:hypothetical protein [Deltaproteobacteria bacterium]